jgi:predicted GTPase
MANVIIMGAAGRDFHDFNVYYRNKADDRVVAFTAAQIPNIADRRYPPELSGSFYSEGIPIRPEEELPELIRDLRATEVVLAYSDVSYVELMHRGSVVLAAGAGFRLLGPNETMLTSQRRVLSVCAVRTGAGKSPLVRRAVEVLRREGLATCVVRHPMPYGDLRKQACQRFATMDDLDRQACTIEEREEYEPHIRAGTVVFAGVDYARVLKQAEAEAEILVWDGGNNDLPFFRPTLHIVVADALRPGHELLYHPGEANARMADAFVITKVDEAPPENVEIVRANLAALNPAAGVSEAVLRLSVPDGDSLRGRRALVIEDGPTITHGGMAYGAGLRAAEDFGAYPVDPRPWAVGSIRDAYDRYPHIGPVLPALGYDAEQLEELEATIRKVQSDVVVVASPVDLGRLLKLGRPAIRVFYDLEIVRGPELDEILAPLRHPDGKTT